MNNKNLTRFWKNKKVFITGHTGFKGAWLSFVLKFFGAKVYGYSLKHQNNFDIFNVLRLNKILDASYINNILDEKKINKIVKNIKPDIVIHLAAQALVRKSYDSPIGTFKTNVIGSLNILNACNKVNSVKAILMITTDKVYQNNEKNIAFKEEDKLGGNDPYSSSKAAAELAIFSYKKSYFENKNKPYVATVRAGNVIGGGDWNQDRLIPDIVKSINLKKKLIIRNPNATRPWQHVLETVWTYMIISKELFQRNSKAQGSWNVGPDSSNFLNVLEVVKILKKKFRNLNYKIIKDKNIIESQFLKLDNNKIKKFFKWKPVLKKKISLN